MRSTFDIQVPRLIVFSAADIDGLKSKAEAMIRCLRDTQGDCFEFEHASINEFAAPLPIRCALLPSNRDNLLEMLENLHSALEKGGDKLPRLASGVSLGRPEGQVGKVAVMFPGFGSEYPGMMEGLLEAFPQAAKWLGHLESYFGLNASEQLPLPVRIAALKSKMDGLEYGLKNGGPAGSIVSLFLYEIIRSLNVPCDMIVGHSNGDNTALAAAGFLEYDSPSQLMGMMRSFGEHEDKGDHAPGAFFAVHNLSLDQLNEWKGKVGEGVFLGMDNCPNQKIVYILDGARQKALDRLKDYFGVAFPVPTEFPFHTALYAPWVPEIKRKLDAIGFKAGHTPLYSCVDSHPFPAQDEAIREKILRQLVEPVRFTQTLRRMHQDGARTFIDCGPNDRLAGFARDTFRASDVLVVSANSAKKDNLQSIAMLAANLWTAGYPVDLQPFLPQPPKPVAVAPPTPQEEQAQPASLPTNGRQEIFLRYQSLMGDFLRSQEAAYAHLSTALRTAGRPLAKAENAHPEFSPAQSPFPAPDSQGPPKELVIEKRIQLADYPLLADHALGRVLPVIPFTLSMEIAAEAAGLLYQGAMQVREIANAQSLAWLALDQDWIDLRVTATVLPGAPEGQAAVSVTIAEVQPATGRAVPAFQAKVVLGPSSKNTQPAIDPKGSVVEMKETFGAYFKDKMFHGPLFRGVEEVISCTPEGVTARMRNSGHAAWLKDFSSPQTRVPGVLLDSTGQLMAYWYQQLNPGAAPIFPYKAENYEQFADFPEDGTPIYCRATIAKKFSGLEGSFEFYTQPQTILGRLSGFQLRFFNTPWIDHIVRGDHRGIPLEGLTEELLQESGGIWKRTLRRLKDNRHPILNHQ